MTGANRARAIRETRNWNGDGGERIPRRINGTAGDTGMNDHPRYLNTREAAAMLGIGARTLERYRESGEGPAFRKFGRRVRYAQSDLDGWADTRRRTAVNGKRGGGTKR